MSKPWNKNPTKLPVTHFIRRVSISIIPLSKKAPEIGVHRYFGNRTSISSHGIKSMSEISQGPPGLEQEHEATFLYCF